MKNLNSFGHAQPLCKDELDLKVQKDPLFNSAWIDFNERKWGLAAEKIELGPERGTSWELRAVLYRDKSNRFVNPPRNPHLPVDFQSSSLKLSSINRRMRVATEGLAEIVKNRGVRGALNLSPVLSDIRPFQWLGLRAVPRYTYHLSIADYRDSLESAVLNKARKAFSLGYRCEVSRSFSEIQECLSAAEERKGFNHQVGATDLSVLSEAMGDEAFVAFLCRNSEGEPVGAWVRIWSPGGAVLAWSAGVKRQALKDGVNNLLGRFALDFFAAQGCTTFDFVGANIPPVAEMKEAWGGRLVQYFSVSEVSWRSVLRDIRDLTARRT